MSDAADLRSQRLQQALDRFWDGLTTSRGGRPADRDPDLNPALTEAIRRLHALDTIPDEDPAFGPRLWEDLMDSATYRGTIPLRPMLPHSNGRSNGHAPTWPRPAIETRHRPGKLHAALSYAVTAALIAAVIGMIAFIYQDQQRAAVPSVQVSPTVSAKPSSSWPMYRGNPARTGEMPGPGLEGTPVELWRVQTAGANSAPAVVDGTLYIGGSDGVLYARAANTGEERWRFSQATAAFGAPTVADGIVYVGNDDSNLYAIDAVTGKELWRFTTGEVIPPAPLVVGGVIYTFADDDGLAALDAKTGAKRWTVPLSSPATRSAAYSDGVIFVGSRNGALHAIDAVSGEERWSVQTGNVDGTIGTPAVSGDTVYTVTFNSLSPSALRAFDVATGQERWTFSPDERVNSTIAVANHTVFVGSADGVFLAVDAATGTERWRLTTNGVVEAAAAVVGEIVYVVSRDGNLFALEIATGIEQWRFAIDGGASFGPVVVGGTVYVCASDGTLYAIGGSDSSATSAGTPLATIATGVSPTVSSESVANTIVEFVWEAHGSDNDPLVQPQTIAIAPDGKLWVPDVSGRFFIFDLDGLLLETWGSLGSGPGQFRFFDGQEMSAGLAFLPDGSFYVADTMNQRIQYFDRDRTFVREWGGQGSGDGQFLAASAIAISPTGEIYVADFRRNDIQWFTADGSFLGAFDGAGTPGGALVSPGGLAFNQRGHIYVVDNTGNQVRIFTTDWADAGLLGEGGPDFGGFVAPWAVAFDSSGNSYICDQEQNRIVVFDPAGHVVYQWGSFGNGDGQFQQPSAIAINARGSAYVIDWYNNRIQKFAITGPFPPPAEATPTP